MAIIEAEMSDDIRDKRVCLVVSSFGKHGIRLSGDEGRKISYNIPALDAEGFSKALQALIVERRGSLN